MNNTLFISKNGEFLDKDGRSVLLRGINFAGDAKMPLGQTSIEQCKDGSFVDSPFPLAEADIHLGRLKSCGFNTLRLIYTWEALEPRPGVYDDDYITYLIKLIEKAEKHGLIVFMDPHQDVWSRTCGGSGAPVWTLYAAGLDPTKFADTTAALLHCNNTKTYESIKMLWASNYFRLACQVMFTLFFAGEMTAPKCRIEGVNIQEYLQGHFLGAVKHLAQRVKSECSASNVIGWESLNEPGHGLIGDEDLHAITPNQMIRLGAQTTAYENMLLGSGESLKNVESWVFSSMGYKKSHTIPILNAGKVSCWLTAAERDEWDSKWGFKRDDGWAPGCIWKLHDIWSPEKGLVKAHYFSQLSSSALFCKHFQEFASTIRSVYPVESNTFVMMQPPVNSLPPSLTVGDPLLVYCPHFYDGLTLMLKKWNKLYNVDSLGYLRGKYPTSALAVRVGEKSIKNSFKSQFLQLKMECKHILGEGVPMILSEIGVPYDMGDFSDYSNQIKAIDSSMHGLEAANVNHTWWVYTAHNSHKRGDNWNGEDLSIFSPSDLKGTGEYWDGIRAAESVIRPMPVFVSGSIISFGFDIMQGVFHLQVEADSGIDKATEIFLPNYYDRSGKAKIETSSGSFDYNHEAQRIYWKHKNVGIHTLRVSVPSRVQSPPQSQCIIF